MSNQISENINIEKKDESCQTCNRPLKKPKDKLPKELC